MVAAPQGKNGHPEYRTGKLGIPGSEKSSKPETRRIDKKRDNIPKATTGRRQRR